MDDKKQNKRTRKLRPALSPEARENQLISMVMDLAEEQIRDKTVSSQVMSYFLRKGAEKEKLELEKLRRENELLKAKTESIQSAKDLEKIYSEAISAMTKYRGDYDTDDY